METGSETSPEWLTAEGAGNRLTLGAGALATARVVIAGNENTLEIGPGVRLGGDDPSRSDLAIHVAGDRNTIVVGADTTLNASIAVEGDGCTLMIGRDCILTLNANLRAGGVIRIGDQTTMVKASLQVHEPECITIGRDCMFSTLVYLSVSDIHPIHDRSTGERINPAQPIVIGDHVWLGLRCMIMKGAVVGEGAVVAAGAVVSGDVPPYSIVGGVPARVLRRDVEWRRDFT